MPWVKPCQSLDDEVLMKELLRKLTDTFGPSGYEAAVRELIRKEIKGFADEVRVDALGNLIARKGVARKRGKKIMIAAHMDEIGVMGLEPTDHASDVPALDKMFIDVGAASKKDCPVRTGDVAAFERPFLDLGARLVAKSMDDRVGCAVAIQALRGLRNTPHEVYFVFTTQEEVGTRGAQTSAYGIDPDLGFSIDITGWGDTPGQKDFEVALGKGPAIKIRDGGMLSDARIVDWMIRAAEKAKIPYQREVLLGGTTDARAMQLVRAGIPVGCISIPCRYVHTPSEMVDVNDAQNAVKLIVALLKSPIEF